MPTKRVVTAGYSILQPRVTPSLTTGDDASFFQRVFSSNRGLDPYVFAVSDLYQDVFGDGSFTGKGLYHVDAFEAALKGRIAENTVLSHDLLEGALARCGAGHRCRGGRGLSDPLFGRRLAPPSLGARRLAAAAASSSIRSSGVPALSRWKMVDNLRRSLTPIFWVMAAIAGWTLLPFTQAAQWQALLILSLFMAPTFDIVNAILPKSRDATRARPFHRAGARRRLRHRAGGAEDRADGAQRLDDGRRHRAHALPPVRQPPEPAGMAHRLAGAQERRQRSRLLLRHDVWRRDHRASSASPSRCWPIPPAPSSPSSSPCSGPARRPSPGWISRSAETEDRLRVSPADTASAAHRRAPHLALFRDLRHGRAPHLPPDNFQESPAPVVAPAHLADQYRRLSAVGRLGARFRLDQPGRCRRPASTRRCRRSRAWSAHRGHLFNWYDTKTLQPLYPLYISAVDSGNLAGHLVAVAAACAEWAEAPSVHLQGDFDGMLDTVTILDESLDESARRPPPAAAAAPAARRPHRRHAPRGRDHQERSPKWPRSAPSISPCWPARSASWPPPSTPRPQSAQQRHHRRLGGQAGSDLRGACRTTRTATTARVDGAARQAPAALRERTRKFAFEMDFSFLLRQERKLLSIGYRVEEHQLDESCYDLLASEARLTSLFAIAKGDLPTEHWFRLGRPIVEIGFQRRADVLVGLDVRVSDAAAGDEGAAGRHPQPDQQADHQAADPVWPLEERAVGHFGSGLQRARPRD